MLPTAVVVLSSEFVAKKDPMEEVRQIVQQRDAGSGQRLCILLHDISYEECSQSVLPEYAADLKKLLGITALRGDQASSCQATKQVICVCIKLQGITSTWSNVQCAIDDRRSLFAPGELMTECQLPAFLRLATSAVWGHSSPWQQ